MKYVKRPIGVEAYQTDKPVDIETPEGTMHADVGDYIITGVNGEKYPCKPDIFKKTYKSADEPMVGVWTNAENKPKENGNKIVYSHSCGVVEAYFNKYGEWEDNEGNELGSADVIYWMPMPLPPKKVCG